MESIRQRQVAELIKRHFGTMLQQEGRYVFGTQPFVTVTNVKMTPDFNIAKIYLSIFNTENKQEVILEMEDNYTRLKQALASRIGKQIRRMPDLHFYIDDTLDEMHRVESLFQRLEADNQMGKPDEETDPDDIKDLDEEDFEEEDLEEDDLDEEDFEEEDIEEEDIEEEDFEEEDFEEEDLEEEGEEDSDDGDSDGAAAEK